MPLKCAATAELIREWEWRSGPISNPEGLPTYFYMDPHLLRSGADLYFVQKLPYGTFSVGEETVSTERGRTGSIIGKLSSEGKLLWHKIIGNGSTLDLQGFGPDREGNITVAGSFLVGTVTFEDGSTFDHGDPFTLGRFDLVVAKFTSSGELLWAKGTSNQEGMRIEAGTQDAAGNTYLFGSGDTLRYDGVACTNYNKVLLKLDSDGRAVWLKNFPFVGFIYDACTTSDGGITFAATAGMNDSFAKTSLSTGSMVVGRFSGNGDQLSVASLRGTGTIWAEKLALDEQGQGVVYGIANRSVLPGTVPVAGGKPNPEFGSPVLLGFRDGKFTWIRYDYGGSVDRFGGETFFLAESNSTNEALYRVADDGKMSLLATSPIGGDGTHLKMFSPTNGYIFAESQFIAITGFRAPPPPPALAMTRNSEGVLTLTWPPAAGYVLERSTTLAVNSWHLLEGSSTPPVVIQPTALQAVEFFRLRRVP
ncbi:MAG TPA: hypothetical protein VEH27_18605 [Methylomirabilota bacterium]|nr:hypothetical protein [Methylomirabilota bacterium]